MFLVTKGAIGMSGASSRAFWLIFAFAGLISPLNLGIR